MIFSRKLPKPAPAGQAAEPSTRIVVLGPQGLEVTVDDVIASLDLPDGSIATITAGWQDREPEDGELDKYLGGRSVGLQLYRRLERAFARDRELADAHRSKQRTLHELRRLYNIRLSASMDAVLALLKERADPELVEPELADAIQALCDLDYWHLKRIAEIWSEFLERYKPHERDAMARERAEVRKDIENCAAVVMTGGHVAVLLNRLRLFRMKELLDGKTIVTWSAGAMVLSERVVLFHDSPPQGKGHAEVFEEGLELISKIIALPHGRDRLELDDRPRVARFARRFEPTMCAILDAGTRLDWDGKRWSSSEGVDVLSTDGTVESVKTW